MDREHPATIPDVEPASGVGRRSVLAAAWATPVIVAALATPAAAASGAASTVTGAEFFSVSSTTTENGGITVTRPLSIRIAGSMSQGDLITLTVGGTMTPAGGGTPRTTPYRISSTQGVNFSQLSSSTGSDGSQVTVLVANRDLAEGLYSKSIAWVPLDGVSTQATEDQISIWPLGDYSTGVAINAAGFAGTNDALTITRVF